LACEGERAQPWYPEFALAFSVSFRVVKPEATHAPYSLSLHILDPDRQLARANAVSAAARALRSSIGLPAHVSRPALPRGRAAGDFSRHCVTFALPAIARQRSRIEVCLAIEVLYACVALTHPARGTSKNLTMQSPMSSPQVNLNTAPSSASMIDREIDTAI
jgi:hypothetical protein